MGVAHLMRASSRDHLPQGEKLEMRTGAGEALQDGTNLLLVRTRDAGVRAGESEAGAQGEVPARGNAHFPPGDAA